MMFISKKANEQFLFIAKKKNVNSNDYKPPNTELSLSAEEHYVIRSTTT